MNDVPLMEILHPLHSQNVVKLKHTNNYHCETGMGYINKTSFLNYISRRVYIATHTSLAMAVTILGFNIYAE